MDFRELKEAIAELGDAELDHPVSIRTNGEWFMLTDCKLIGELPLDEKEEAMEILDMGPDSPVLLCESDED